MHGTSSETAQQLMLLLHHHTCPLLLIWIGLEKSVWILHQRNIVTWKRMYQSITYLDFCMNLSQEVLFWIVWSCHVSNQMSSFSFPILSGSIVGGEAWKIEPVIFIAINVSVLVVLPVLGIVLLVRERAFGCNGAACFSIKKAIMNCGSGSNDLTWVRDMMGEWWPEKINLEW